VSASGNIELSSRRQVALGVEGIVDAVHVQVGDRVQAGDLLLSLETIELERAAKRAELEVQAQLNTAEQAKNENSALDIAAAQANLASALANLAQVRAGPSADEIAAARSTLSSAQAAYNGLLAGPPESELAQLSADLKKKEIAMQEAQTAYDEVAWLNNVGMTSQSSALQQAVIDYEAAQAAYDQAAAPASEADLQSALSSVQSAQHALDDLLMQPLEADIASAEAAVAQAQAELDDLQSGTSETELRTAQISLEQALVDLQEAYANLANAKVIAPIDGTVLEVAIEAGQQGTRGAAVVTLADTTQLELTIHVAEVDIPQLEAGQEAEIVIDALPEATFRGSIAYIAPASDEESELVNYPVTIQLAADQSLDKVRPGMTAVASIAATNTELRGGWLVPTTAIRQAEGAAVVTVMRDGAATPVEVIPKAAQGEWTVVESDQLRAGDEVVGTLVSQLDQMPVFGPGRGGGFRVPGGGGGGGGSGGR
jgi:HlyD family secretion protein